MRNILLANLILLLSLLHATTAQFPAADCILYSRIANMSVIGTNSTMRSAFIQASPDGTFKTGDMLNLAMKQLPALTANVALNQQCGNLTTIAMKEAARNFSQGIVAQFSGIHNPTAIFAGWELLPMFGGIGILFFVIWSYI